MFWQSMVCVGECALAAFVVIVKYVEKLTLYLIFVT